MATDKKEIAARIKELQEQHREFDSTIIELIDSPIPNQFRINRLKKEKLQCKDEIALLEDLLFPDIIA